MRRTCLIACVLHWQNNKSLPRATTETNGFRHLMRFTFVCKVLLDATLTEIDTTGCNGGPFLAFKNGGPFLPEGSPTNNHSVL